MEFQGNSRLKLTVVLILVLHSVCSQTVGTDCNGKTFYCIDDEQFQVCADLPDGKSQIVDDTTYPCPADSFCDNAGQKECDSQTRPTTTTTVAPESTTTTAQSTSITSTESTTTDAAPSTSTTSTESTTTTAAPSTTTTLPSSTTTTTEAPFSCTRPGRFPNRNDCHRYYTCRQVSTGLRQTDSKCSFGMAFNPVSQGCYIDQSPCYATFQCQSSGRFPDPSDVKSYFWCMRNGSSYVLLHLSCSFGQSFEPNRGQCSGWLGVR